MKHIAIVGNGIAGITAARHIRKRGNDRISVISAESRHFYSRTALMYIYMGHMTFEHTKPYEDWFWERNRIDLIQDRVTQIDFSGKQMVLAEGGALAYDVLLLATGSKSNLFGWKGQDLTGVQTLYSIQDLERLERNSAGVTRAVIVGGGLIGIELAEMLRTRGIGVTFLIMESHYWGNVLRREEAELIARHAGDHGVDFRFETQLAEIIAGPDGRARAVLTDQGEEIPCELVGLTAGVHPNLELVADSPIATGRGIRVNTYLETNIADVYAAGDCAEIVDGESATGRVEQLWYTGRMQGEAVARYQVRIKPAMRPLTSPAIPALPGLSAGRLSRNPPIRSGTTQICRLAGAPGPGPVSGPAGWKSRPVSPARRAEKAWTGGRARACSTGEA